MHLSVRDLVTIAAGCALMAFAVVNIHIPAKITEGGVLGMSVFLYKIFGLSPSWVSPLLDFSCYVIGFSLIGRVFIRKAAFATLSYSAFYSIFSGIGRVLPDLSGSPLIASVLGGLCIGLGCGMVVIHGAAAGGDDALALIVERRTRLSLGKAYLFSDVVVLTLSLLYIPVTHIIWSFLTTVVSSYLVGQFEVKMPRAAEQAPAGNAAHMEA